MVPCNQCSFKESKDSIIHFDDAVFIYITHPSLSGPMIITKNHNFRPKDEDINGAIEFARSIWPNVKVGKVVKTLPHWYLDLEIAR